MGFRYGGDSLPAEEPLLPEEGIGAAISGLLLLQPAGYRERNSNWTCKILLT